MSRVEHILHEWPTLLLTRDPRSRLYKALCRAFEVAELCVINPKELQVLESAIRERPSTGNRTYIEESSDIYVRVCRFLFANESRHNISRYTVTLRRAAESKITIDNLYSHLVEQGGVNALTRYNRNNRSLTKCPHCGGKL